MKLIRQVCPPDVRCPDSVIAEAEPPHWRWSGLSPAALSSPVSSEPLSPVRRRL